MRKLVATISILGFLAGCASTPQQNVNAETAAKIRVFHGTSVYMYPGSSCYGGDNPEKIYGAGGFSMLTANTKVGMPVTDDIPWSYHEYLIPSGKPLTLEMYYSAEGDGMRHSCGPIGATFTPEPGKFYDTSMIFASGQCSIQLRELHETSPGKADAIALKPTPAIECSRNPRQSN